ncbi:hypothetical protein AK830_g4699 [Neonectria ditissima]|uniref:Uncharacterized protein n=1 Tax=Neonectria ditissima TaxID=78410 RepID=A0A0P7B7M9_9HYPO|nr:hypothetical protein AK830_g4699 [Neonectria ditissima]
MIGEKSDGSGPRALSKEVAQASPWPDGLQVQKRLRGPSCSSSFGHAQSDRAEMQAHRASMAEAGAGFRFLSDGKVRDSGASQERAGLVKAGRLGRRSAWLRSRLGAAKSNSVFKTLWLEWFYSRRGCDVSFFPTTKFVHQSHLTISITCLQQTLNSTPLYNSPTLQPTPHKMISKNLALTLALLSAASAAPTLKRQDPCQDAYKACIANGTPEVACSCTLTACVGEDNARNREFCASATASLAQPTSTGIPGGCNPAHPGSCPSSYFTYTTEVPESTASAPEFTSVSGIPGGCNPAHPGSCPSSYFTYTTDVPESTATAAPEFTSISGIPGGCNPAHPGSCPSSYFTYTTEVVETTTETAPTFTSIAGIPGGCNPAHPGSCPSSYFTATTLSTVVAQPTGGVVYADPVAVEGKQWTISDLTRYCAEDNSGCDYNFAIEADGKTERCTVIRMPGADAATENWSDEPCTTGSEFKVSWGYVTEPAPAFAVVTVVEGKELAWFGVSNVNEQEVTPSSPFGSGEYGTLGPQQVYTY